MRCEPGGRLIAEARDLAALLATRREQLARLEAELAALPPREREPYARRLHTARWSVETIAEKLEKERHA